MHRRPRHGWTATRIVILLLVAMAVGIILSKVDFGGYRMDASARELKSQLIAQQLTAVKFNMPVIVAIAYDRGTLTITRDANGNGTADGSEVTTSRALTHGARFVIPPVAIGGAAPYYATGPGLTYLNQSYRYPTVTFYPNGATSGEVAIYIGSASGGRADLRALQITGASSKVTFYRFAAGAWKPADM